MAVVLRADVHPRRAGPGLRLVVDDLGLCHRRRDPDRLGLRVLPRRPRALARLPPGALAAVGQASEAARLGRLRKAEAAKGGNGDDGKSDEPAKESERAKARGRDEKSGGEAATRCGQGNREVDRPLSTRPKIEWHRIGDHGTASHQPEAPPETEQDERPSKSDY